MRLSHVFRGHPSALARVTHGWLCEGDAQRDAFHVLTQMLADRRWTKLAREARAAQVKLSSRQPPAYRQFPVSESERMRLATYTARDHADHWIVTTPRLLEDSAFECPFEVPVIVDGRSGAPVPGDTVYIIDGGDVVGPWIVLARTGVSLASHQSDANAVERSCPAGPASVSARRPPPPVEWLQLRPLTELRHGPRNEDIRFPSALQPERLSSMTAATTDATLTADVTHGRRGGPRERERAIQRWRAAASAD